MTDTRPTWGNCPPLQPLGPVPTAFESLVTRCLSGDFHTPPRKSSFFQPFLRFFLAFCFFLGYSPFRPEFFRWYMGGVGSRPASIRIGVERKIRRIRILDGSPATEHDQGCGANRRESRHSEDNRRTI